MDLDAMIDGVRGGKRRALARAITLVESARSEDRKAAAALLDGVADPRRQALRIGLSGTPGVGKSTFIEASGLMLIGQGRSVAVLAVDPSSTRSGGSILGDKTRMPQLSRDPRAFIRPSPSQTELGGVARRTREAIALCEAAGFDVVIVETVGVGQSETIVAQMTDIFTLLLAPGGGDELQGVKRGIMEIADLILINKADGDMKAQAERTRADYAGALHLLRRRDGDPEGFPKALSVSSTEDAGLSQAWEEMASLADYRRGTGHWDRTRAAQSRHWFEEAVRHGIVRHLTADAATRARMEDLGRAVAAGETAPSAAADRMIEHLFGRD
ncbi:methylmalonyl Co-A mutase-associated GTPase MeaB [Palleronia sp. LCG004]|uniref:methylmalonyl Co-A mutase-associated GTPase MeaB n=1 Tax=Palleronia sp. LCG004 TaxID=3079304 RepID=UPI002941FDAF|nr:methylmalonyl Co-A mutase-associated GTPase MeaB [Palleronia sp. LCG004]WOI56950.1 methylmalonyl Co-A mutase-associated GTPase MeaB [Palleronia sp. LCG004]